jgi:hypothetical protein
VQNVGPSLRGVHFRAQGITSAKGLQGAGANFRTLASGMAAANVTWVDVLKVDIEGTENTRYPAACMLVKNRVRMRFAVALAGSPPLILSEWISMSSYVKGICAPPSSISRTTPHSSRAKHLAAQQCIEYAFVKVADSGQLIQGL